ncbi:MAG TPA: HEAT repeat domain-containing protein [Kofleriaceae bacterium]|nr:HEAT repeat domain-containing protein [Kofleriaceae bacterium]
MSARRSTKRGSKGARAAAPAKAKPERAEAAAAAEAAETAEKAAEAKPAEPERAEAAKTAEAPEIAKTSETAKASAETAETAASAASAAAAAAAAAREAPRAQETSKAQERPARSRRRGAVIAALVGAAAIAAVVAYARRDGAQTPAPVAGPRDVAAEAGRAGMAKPAAVGSAKPAAASTAAAAGSAGSAKPSAAAPAAAGKQAPSTYVGSARCGDCHEKEHARWKASWHARALSPGKRPYVVGNFENAHFKGSSSEAWMKRVGDRHVMRATDVAGKPADFDVSWVIGGKRMQDAVAVMPDGRWQVLPVYFHVTGKGEWVDYTETKQGALTPEHPFYWTNVRRMANHECLDCHVTALRVAYDEPSRKWSTSFTDGTVACESCHGPGSRHAESQEERDIVHPTHAGAVGQSACARCHGPRKPLFPMLDPDHQFELGQPYDEFYDPVTVVTGDGISPEFFVDGKPKTSSFEYQAVLQAACFRKGNATCLTCHTAPHDPKLDPKLGSKQGHAELRDNDPDASCRKCHADVAQAGSAHTHHTAPAAQRCVACHMAPIVSGVLDKFADHSIDVPVPENTERHGVPSACGVCHADKPPAALATQLAGWWPNAKVRQARRLRLANAFDPETAKESARPLRDVITDATEAPTLRGAAAVLAGRRFGPKTAPTLLPLLDSPDVLLRAKGCEALAAARATGAADALARRLEDSSLRVRLAAALALFELRDPRGEPALRRLADAPESTNLLLPHFLLGGQAASRGDFAAARRELTSVVRLSPYFTEGLLQLAAVSAAGGDLVEARARVEQALQLEPHHTRGKAMRQQLEAAQRGAPRGPEK